MMAAQEEKLKKEEKIADYKFVISLLYDYDWNMFGIK